LCGCCSAAGVVRNLNSAHSVGDAAAPGKPGKLGKHQQISGDRFHFGDNHLSSFARMINDSSAYSAVQLFVLLFVWLFV